MTRIILASLVLLVLTNGEIQPPKPLTAEQGGLVCSYRLTYQPNSTLKSTRTEYMRLTIGTSMSKFESEGFFLRDSLIDMNYDMSNPGIVQKYVDQVVLLPKTKFKYSIYKNTSKMHLYCYDRVGYSAIYRYDEPDNLFKWTIVNNQKSTVAGYPCQKAITSYSGRTYEAWFTRDIPVSEGPYKFYGLPGLIVKISDTRQQYTFELVKLKKPTITPAITLPQLPSKLTTAPELRQAQLNNELSLIDRLAAMGNKISIEEKQARQKKIKSENNYLEIW